MNVPEVIEVKNHLSLLKEEKKLITEWELPYENILTRRSAAIFFLTPTNEQSEEQIWKELSVYPGFSYRQNEEKKLSTLKYRVTFDKDITI